MMYVQCLVGDRVCTHQALTNDKGADGGASKREQADAADVADESAGSRSMRSKKK
jgi:hypothetical protein